MLSLKSMEPQIININLVEAQENGNESVSSPQNTFMAAVLEIHFYVMSRYFVVVLGNVVWAFNFFFLSLIGD